MDSKRGNQKFPRFPRMWFSQKRGQFYLIAAIIIIGALIGIVTVTNFAITRQSADEIKVYQLSQELKLESEQVINYGILKSNLGTALTEFTAKYSSYIGDKENDVYFIYGDKKAITVIGYVSTDTGSVDLDFGGNPVRFPIDGNVIDIKGFDFSNHDDLNELFGCGSECYEYVNNGELTQTNVIVEVAGTKYPLNIKEGENFFFVIQQANQDNEAIQ